MKKLIFCFSLISTLLFSACIDKHEEVDEESMPSWLGSSIYDELTNRSSGQLTGTFNTYLRLVDDLGYAETLGRTGSKTVFPANDEAFEEFFKSDNAFGVSSYEQLSEAQKKMLLYYSMLDNAILTQGLSNVNAGGDDILTGAAIKHPTNLNVRDTITYMANPALVYPNNAFWRGFAGTGIHTVNDATTPMLVHFTREYFLNNEITTVGEGSDFSILMGDDYDGTSAYVLRNKIVNPNVTCQNGYIHQVEHVVVPPGNLAQLLKRNSNTTIISRLLDRFAYPYLDNQTTEDYNDWAVQNNQPTIDAIYDVRYLSSTTGAEDATNTGAPTDERLNFNPGWNRYTTSNSTGGDASIMSLAAMLVPTDEAMMEYFINNGSGQAIIAENAAEGVPNDSAHIFQNIDSIPRNLVASILNNLMKTSFVTTVPSKFDAVTNDVREIMELELDDVVQNVDGTYDIDIANNAVVYYLNNMKAPVTLSAVSGVTRIRNNMKVMRWAITDDSNSANSLLLDYYAYLQAMSARFGLFVPTDDAFGKTDFFYTDPATLGRTGTNPGSTPEAVHYWLETSVTNVNGVETETSTLRASRWMIDPETFEVLDSVGDMAIGSYITRIRAHFNDILNYHTVVFNSTDNPMQTFNRNRYYKTKHGGEILIDGTAQGNTVRSGAQINSGLPASNIEEVSEMDNGTTFQIDRVIQGPVESVYKVLHDNEQFSSFLELCEGFNDADLMNWVGISTTPDETTHQIEAERYYVFDGNDGACLDQNVTFFNSYNYTVYAPNNEAMDEAYANGLPTWEYVQNLYEIAQYTGNLEQGVEDALHSIQIMRDFVRQHFQRSSVYADVESRSGNYSVFLTDDLGISQNLSVSVADNVLTVTDLLGNQQQVNANDDSKMSNRMTRDFELSAARNSSDTNLRMTTSSFAVVHEISHPFYYYRPERAGETYFSKTFIESRSGASAKTHNFNR